MTLPRLVHRTLLALVLLPAALAALSHTDDVDEGAVKDVAKRFYAAYAAKDLDAFMALWSEKSPDYAARKKIMAGLYAETGPIEVKSLTVIRVRRDGNSASVRVRVELLANDVKTGKPHSSFGVLDRMLDLRREGGTWKVMRYEPSGRPLMERLVAAKTKAERLRLLDDNSDLVGPNFVLMLLREGMARSKKGSYDQTAVFLEAAEEIAESLGDAVTLGWCWVDRGVRLRDQAHNDEAIAAYEKALRLFRGAHDRQAEGKTLYNMGLAYGDNGRFSEALQHYEEGLKIKRELEDRVGEAQMLNGIGEVCCASGRYAESLQSEQDAIQISRELGDRLGEANSLLCIGEVLKNVGRHTEALRSEQDALKIFRELGNRLGEAHILNNMGIVHRKTGRYAESLLNYEDSLKIKRELGDRRGEARTLGNIGTVYHDMKQYAEALRNYQDSLKIKRELGDRDGEAATLGAIGEAYLETGKYDQALQQMENALEIVKAVGNIYQVAWLNLNKGRVYQKQKRWGKAVAAYRESICSTELVRSNSREPTLQSSFLAQNTDPYFRLAQCQLEIDAPAEAFTSGERMKARGLVDILQQGKADLHRGMSADERQQEQKLQDGLTALAMQLENLRSKKADLERQTNLAADLDKARGAYDAFLRDLFLHRPDLATRRAEFAPASLNDLGAALFAGRTGLVVLSYLVGEKETLLFVLTAPEKEGGAARLMAHRIDVGSKELAEAVASFRDACSDPVKGQPDSEELYRRLITPVADELTDAKQIIVIPDSVLHTLPFQALRDPDSKYLLERFAVSYAPSVTALVKMEELGARRRKQYAGKPPSLLAVGISDFGRRETFLPDAEKEALAVAEVWGESAKLLPGAKATLAQVEASWSGRRYLHFATHGRLNPDAPLYSSLVLHSGGGDEGVLFARDLVDADVPAELAVMSACETGLGRSVNGEGLLGLSWAWFAAGVPSTVASQWSVGDASTARLMKAFYARLKAGDSKAEALRQAELKLLKDDATKNPYYWAPFVLVGDDQ